MHGVSLSKVEPPFVIRSLLLPLLQSYFKLQYNEVNKMNIYEDYHRADVISAR